MVLIQRDDEAQEGLSLSKGISRRELLHILAAGTMSSWGTVLFPKMAHSAMTNGFKPVKTGLHSQIVEVSGKAVDPQGRIDSRVVREMFFRGLLAFTGKESEKKAWDVVLPRLTEKDRITLKLNCINSRLPTHPELAYSVAESLARYGVQRDHISMWDRIEKMPLYSDSVTKSGYKISTKRGEFIVAATDTEGFGYSDSAKVTIPSLNETLGVSSILAQADHIIDMPVLKDHSGAGVTFAMKNFYGAIPLWDVFNVFRIRRIHRNHCDPIIPELYSNPIIRHKVRLIVGDMLMGIFQGGPGGAPQWVENKILIAQDPVAADVRALSIIDGKRKEYGLPLASKKAGYIATAARMGMGTSHPEEIELISLKLK